MPAGEALMRKVGVDGDALPAHLKPPDDRSSAAMHSPLLSLLLALLFSLSHASRVYELSDQFLEVYAKDSRAWLVKFYAPWCHFCKQLEPVYMQVAQKLASDASDVVVARADCTRWTALSTTFPVRGFPTILYIRGDIVVEFDGERTKDEIADFAVRLSGPSVHPVSRCSDLDTVLHQRQVFFLHVGLTVPPYFAQAASKYRSISWFYNLNLTSCPALDAGTYVIKGNSENRVADKFDESFWNSTMNAWIRRERFPIFVKVTPSSLNHITRSGKVLVMAVVEELHSVGKLASGKDEEFMSMMQAIASAYEHRDQFIFGSCSHIDLVHSLTVHSVTSIPALVAINTTDMSYAVLTAPVLPQEILALLDSIRNKTQEFQGGNNWWIRFKRSLFDLIVSLVNMYHANPILTLLVFGLPFSFFALIVYSTCFSDLLDAPEDDDTEEPLINAQGTHQKRD